MTARNFVRTLLAISVAAYSFPAAALTELTDATQVSVGTGFACVVTTAGGVKCWGNNAQGELGDRRWESRSTKRFGRCLRCG